MRARGAASFAVPMRAGPQLEGMVLGVSEAHTSSRPYQWLCLCLARLPAPQVKDCRITYRRSTPYNTKSNRIRPVKTPGECLEARGAQKCSQSGCWSPFRSLAPPLLGSGFAQEGASLPARS